MLKVREPFVRDQIPSPSVLQNKLRLVVANLQRQRGHQKVEPTPPYRNEWDEV
jgi:hypothetical protein